MTQSSPSSGPASSPDTFPNPGPADRSFSLPRLLSLATLEWLMEQGSLDPQPHSPLYGLVQGPRISAPSQRARAGEELLASLGVRDRRGARSFRFKASWLGRALSVLANPEARLRIALVVPGQAPIIHSLFVRDGRAVYSESDLEGFYLSEPLATSDLVEFLLATVSSRALPRELEALCLLPEVYELSSVLWKKRGKAASDPISLREVENLLESGPHRRNAALELLGVLLEVGLIEPVGSRYFITESFRPWLDLVWSGQVVEIERTPLAQPAELEAEPTGQRMIFAGPAGRRILCEDIVASAGEPLVLLTRPTRCDLKVRLSRLMRPLAAGATAQGAQVARMADASEEPLNRLIDIN